MDRRNFIGAAGAAMAAGVLASSAAAAAGDAKKKVRILGIACSPRKGMTTAKAVQTALDAAKGADARIEVELIDLGGMNIAGHSPTLPKDDFDAILPKLQDPALGGLLIGSPSYLRSLSSLCKAFIERCMPLHGQPRPLAGKPVGVVAVGGFRNGGQELVIQQIQTAMLSFGMLPAGGESPAYLGATLVSTKDDIAGDEVGLDTARKLGARVAELAIKLGA